jgi:hypothetical protein
VNGEHMSVGQNDVVGEKNVNGVEGVPFVSKEIWCFVGDLNSKGEDGVK